MVEAVILLSPIVTPYSPQAQVLRRFGARISAGVVIKPHVHVKYAWHLEIGDDALIDEQAWIDNFVRILFGANATVSQGAYPCTGNHGWSDPGIGPGGEADHGRAWSLNRGVRRDRSGFTVGREASVTVGSVMLGDAEHRGI